MYVYTYRYIVSPGIRRMSRTAAPHQPLTNQFAVPSVYLRDFSVTDWWHGKASRCKGSYVHSYINVYSLELQTMPSLSFPFPSFAVGVHQVPAM